MATQGFIWKEITWPPGLLEKKKATAMWCLFRRYFLTEKERGRVIENKGDEFRRKRNMEIQSGGEKMRSGQQGAT